MRETPGNLAPRRQFFRLNKPSRVRVEFIRHLVERLDKVLYLIARMDLDPSRDIAGCQCGDPDLQPLDRERDRFRDEEREKDRDDAADNNLYKHSCEKSSLAILEVGFRDEQVDHDMLVRAVRHRPRERKCRGLISFSVDGDFVSTA